MREGVSAMKRKMSIDTNVVAAKDQVSSNLGDEIAILNLEAGTYYGLDAVGARIWTLIQEPKSVGQIRDILVNEYEVDPERCESDLFMLLQSMADEGLIEVRDETLA
jgi:hypothetical protein